MGKSECKDAHISVKITEFLVGCMTIMKVHSSPMMTGIFRIDLSGSGQSHHSTLHSQLYQLLDLGITTLKMTSRDSLDPLFCLEE